MSGILVREGFVNEDRFASSDEEPKLKITILECDKGLIPPTDLPDVVTRENSVGSAESQIVEEAFLEILLGHISGDADPSVMRVDPAR